MNFDYEETVMNLIMRSGTAKSLCFEALSAAKSSQFDRATELMKEAQEEFRAAHEVQTRLIGLDEGTGKVPVHLVMVHAQDHLMTSMLAKEFISELIELYQRNASATADTPPR